MEVEQAYQEAHGTACVGVEMEFRKIHGVEKRTQCMYVVVCVCVHPYVRSVAQSEKDY